MTFWSCISQRDQLTCLHVQVGRVLGRGQITGYYLSVVPAAEIQTILSYNGNGMLFFLSSDASTLWLGFGALYTLSLQYIHQALQIALLLLQSPPYIGNLKLLRHGCLQYLIRTLARANQLRPSLGEEGVEGRQRYRCCSKSDSFGSGKDTNRASPTPPRDQDRVILLSSSLSFFCFSR